MNIFLGLDENCISEEKIITGRLGGTERFFLILWNFLLDQEHYVSKVNDRNFDIAIYSNTSREFVTAKKHICWCGSFHTDAAEKPYDLIIANSQFMLDTINSHGVVIPACYEKQVELYKTSIYNPGKIITTSNPNRHILFTEQACELLIAKKINFTWIITGGNKLYSDSFNEQFVINSQKLQHRILNRTALLREVANSHLYCYPNFEDNSETQCVAAIEAAALDVSVVLPNRLPFTEILPDNPYFCDNLEDMVELIPKLLSCNRGRLEKCKVDKYAEKNILPQIHNQILKIVEEKNDNR